MHDALFAQYFDETHDAYRDACRQFVRAEIQPHVETWEEAGGFPRALYKKAAESGILAAGLPEQYGGGGGDVFHTVVAAEELQRGGSAGVAVGLSSHAIALPPILALGTEEQKQRFVVPVLSGDKVAALAITEPGAGSDVAGVRTRAVQDGDHYRISGEKTFITSGVNGDFITVLARTSDHPHRGLTFFVVERGMPGFTVGRALKKTGWWASDTAELHFDDVVVPVANRIGPEGSGFVALMNNFAGERLLLAVNGCALAMLALEEAHAYAQQREAFGRTLAGFQVTRHKLARMATQVASARALTYAAAARLNRGEVAMDELAMAKNHAGDVARDVCWEAVQIFGGMGYMRECRVERLARDARLLPIGGGTQEIMNELIARGMGL